MAQEQTTSPSAASPVGPTHVPAERDPEAEALLDDADELLDEIDGLLEDPAEVITQYRQKGGQ